MSDEPVIYGLTDDSGQIIYVGQSVRPYNRLRRHRKRFGAVVNLVTLQNGFTDETACEAERRWIKKLAADGLKLRNILHNSVDDEPKKRLTIDVCESLHRRVKIGCMARGVEMAEMLRLILEREFPE